MANRSPHPYLGSPAKKKKIRAAADQVIRNIELLENRLLMTVSLDAAGWTVVTPTPGVSRMIYVSSSTGSDSNSGLSPSALLATIAHAVSLVRNNEPDWILLDRGDTFHEDVTLTASGLSAQQPMVLTYYGNPALPRPVVDGGKDTAIHTGFANQYVDIIGISFTTSTHDPNSPNFNNTGSNGLSDSGTSDLLVEDCSFSYFMDDVVIQSVAAQINDVTIRRCEILDSFDTSGHSEGLYAQQVYGITIDENYFDHDGWNTQVAGAGPTGYNHDCYLHSSNTGVVVTDNVFADASSVGLQARAGGIVDNNLFINDPYGLSFGLVNGSTTKAGGVTGEVIGNVILEPRVDTANSYGIGMQIGNLAPGGGTVVADNIIADSSYDAAAVEFAPGVGVVNPTQAVGLNSLNFEDNTIYHWGYGIHVSSAYQDGTTGPDGLTGVVIQNNAFQDNVGGRIIEHGNAFNPADETWSGNIYSSSTAPTSQWFEMTGALTTTSLATWKATVEPTAISQTLAYADPTRTIESYMASLGLTPSESAFASGLASESGTNWNGEYSAQSVISYIEAGFTTGGALIAAPVAVATAPTTTSQTPTVTTFTITYSDNVPLDLSSISAATVSVAGPNGVSLPASFSSVNSNTNGTFVTATYSLASLNGWANTPVGTYDITLTSSVSDSDGDTISPEQVGSFVNSPTAVVTTPVATPAIQPANFSAVSKPTGVLLSWTEPGSNATSFTLTRATNSSFTQNVTKLSLSGSKTSYNDTTVGLGQIYYYKLTATNSAGTSTATPAVSAIIVAPGNPATTPRNLTAVAQNTGIVLSWTDPANDQTGFIVVRATDVNFTQNVQRVVLSASTFNYVDSSAGIGQTYYYELLANNNYGLSAPTAAVSAVIIPQAATTPINFAATTTATAIELTWSDPANDQTSFNLTRATNASLTQNVQVVPVAASATSFMDTSALAGQTYYYSLKAVNAIGPSAPTPTVSSIRSATPPTPSNFTAVAKATDIVLTWTESLNLQTGYTLTRATNASFTQNVQNVAIGATALTFTDTSAVAGITYYYKLTATNSLGASGTTPAVSASIVAGTMTPTTPTNFTAVAGTTDIVLTWNDSAGDETGFTLTRATNSSFTQNVLSAPIGSGVRSFTDSSTVAGQLYYYRLTATNSHGNSSPTPAVSVKIQAATKAPSATTPVNFSAIAGPSAIVLSWSDPAADQTGFTLVRATNLSFTQNVQQVSLGSSTTSYTDTSVTKGQTYYYELIAVNSGGSSAPTPAVGAVVALALAPTTPGNFAIASGASSIVLTWNASGGNQSGFTLERSTSFGFTSNVTSVSLAASATSYTDTSAVAGQIYYYKLIATNSAGSSAPTATLSGVIVAVTTAPSTPGNFTATAGTSNISLSWTIPAGNPNGFTLQRATDAAFTQNLTTASLAATATSFNDVSVAAGTTYYYRLYAQNTVGSSAPTATVSAAVATATAAAAPSTPTDFAATDTVPGIVLSWSDPAKDQTGFILIRATNSTFTQGVQSVSLSSSTTQYTDASAVTGQTYYYELIAKNTMGYSTPTKAVMMVR